MTTIATDGKVLAGDGRVTAGFEILCEDDCKVDQITKMGRKVSFASAGLATVCEDFKDWMQIAYDFEKEFFLGSFEPELTAQQEREPFSAVVVTGSGVCYYVTKNTRPIRVQLPFAIGSGDMYAVGAMLAGKKPIDAVKIAAMRDNATNSNVTCVKCLNNDKA